MIEQVWYSPKYDRLYLSKHFRTFDMVMIMWVEGKHGFLETLTNELKKNHELIRIGTL